MNCPNCNKTIDEKVIKCECGYDFAEKKVIDDKKYKCDRKTIIIMLIALPIVWFRFNLLPIIPIGFITSIIIYLIYYKKSQLSKINQNNTP
jgi:hypothetical protein